MNLTNRLFLLFFALVCIMTSCSDCVEGVSVLVHGQDETALREVVSFRTSMVDCGDITRTYLETDPDNAKVQMVMWTAGEGVAVFTDNYAQSAAAFTATVGGSTSTTLSGSAAKGAARYCAVSPYSAVGEGSGVSFSTKNSSTATVTKVTIPYRQTAVEDSYDPTAGIMVASTTADDKNFAFRNACCYIKVKLGNHDCTRIDLVADAQLAGVFDATLTAADATLTPNVASGDVRNAIELTAAEGGNLKANSVYYIAIAPCTVYNMRVTCHYTENGVEKYETFIRSFANGYSCARNKNIMFGTLDTAKNYTKILTGNTADMDLGETDGHSWVRFTPTDGTASSVKFAEMNLGATTVAQSVETAYGDYYTWGEVETYYSAVDYTNTSNPFTWKTTNNTHIKGEKTGYTTTNYYGSSSNLAEWSTKPYDDSGILTADYDAATVNWSSNWRMPTLKEYQTLIGCCSVNVAAGASIEPVAATSGTDLSQKGIYWISADENISGYSVCGILFVQDATHRVFFPAAGCCKNAVVSNVGTHCDYWTSTLVGDGTHQMAYVIDAYSTSLPQSDSKPRYSGYSVRAVTE